MLQHQAWHGGFLPRVVKSGGGGFGRCHFSDRRLMNSSCSLHMCHQHARRVGHSFIQLLEGTGALVSMGAECRVVQPAWEWRFVLRPSGHGFVILEIALWIIKYILLKLPNGTVWTQDLKQRSPTLKPLCYGRMDKQKRCNKQRLCVFRVLLHSAFKEGMDCFEI